MNQDHTCDHTCAVVGGGATGLLVSLLLAREGIPVLLFAAPPEAMRGQEGRSVAILQKSVDTLSLFAGWDDLLGKAAPLRHLRIIDDTHQLIRAPETLFSASEVGMAQFGVNILNTDLIKWLYGCVCTTDGITVVKERVVALHTTPFRVHIQTNTRKEYTARLCIGADGHRSLVRQFTDIPIHKYGQDNHVIVARCQHAAPHYDTVTEFHTEKGPFTLVPFSGDTSCLVWVGASYTLDAFLTLPQNKQEEQLEQKAHGVLRKMSFITPPYKFSTSCFLAHRFISERCVLLGEAAHALPPLGAQGLNLGIRDAVFLSGILGAASQKGMDIGDSSCLRPYEKERGRDARLRLMSVTLLSQTLVSPSLFMQSLRGVGMTLLRSAPFPLRRFVMRRGVGY